MPTLPPTDLLRSAGLRVTAPRVAVLEVLDQHPHSDATAILQLTRQRSTGISVQGVYDVLSSLTDRGLLRRIQPAHSVARYEVDQGDNHHHVVCRDCHTIVDVPCDGAAAPCLDPGQAEALGFAVDEAEVIYWGACSTCRTAADPGGRPGTSPHTSRTITQPTKKEKA
ncbi:Fur family transcriptional regulator [Ornithinimicrobium flavum]|uniref:Fur family transcriptional regulator n=1 Tax=Ornithinimicrobium flavum TaxID=1288636 RepID=UPI00106F6B16|nr:Fur family transcriptional regulator [Ornithinimicrobium flavum]